MVKGSSEYFQSRKWCLKEKQKTFHEIFVQYAGDCVKESNRVVTFFFKSSIIVDIFALFINKICFKKTKQVNRIRTQTIFI